MNKEQIAKLAKFKELRQAATNASFDCGEFDDDDAHEAYRALALKANELNEQVDKFVEKLLAERSTAPVSLTDAQIDEIAKPYFDKFIVYGDFRRFARSVLSAAGHAPAATQERIAQLEQQREELGQEVRDLVTALAFWMPKVEGTEGPLAERVFKDCFLLAGIDGNLPDDFKTAQELGWITLVSGTAVAAAPAPIQKEPEADNTSAWTALQEILESKVTSDNPEAFKLKMIAVDAFTGRTPPTPAVSQSQGQVERKVKPAPVEGSITREEARAAVIAVMKANEEFDRQCIHQTLTSEPSEEAKAFYAKMNYANDEYSSWQFTSLAYRAFCAGCAYCLHGECFFAMNKHELINDFDD